MLLWKWKRLVLLALLVGLTPVLARTSQADQTGVAQVRIMSFNIWVGGDLVDFGQVVAAVQAAEADIVGLQEASGNARRLAEALGWQHVSEQMNIISRYPLIHPPGANGNYIFAQLRPGEVVALANVHLPSDPYGPYAVRDGATITEVLEIERDTRLPAIEPQLPIWSELAAAGMPVLLTGDFNSPSYRDWTAEVAEAREQVKFPVEWPVSQAVETAGFQDTYRAAHPDPVERPGNTWTYGYPYPRLNPDEMIDRIDFVYAAGDVEVLGSEIVGEAGGPDVDIGLLPFPSDHRGVVSTLRLRPVAPPLFVAPDHRRVEVGEPIVVRYHAPNGEESDQIALVPAGGAADTPLMWLPPYEASFHGSVTFGTGTLAPGAYDTLLLGPEGEELSRNTFWVVERDAQPALSLDKAVYGVGESIGVSWSNAPGSRFDWLGVYAAGDPDLYNGYLGFVYTRASVAGSLSIDGAILGDEMLPPGDYEVRLLADDGYAVLATAPFSVVE